MEAVRDLPRHRLDSGIVDQGEGGGRFNEANSSMNFIFLLHDHVTGEQKPDSGLGLQCAEG